MGGGGGDQNDAIARQQPADAVDDQRGFQRPARQGLGLDLRQTLLGHPGIMLQGHGGDGIADPVAHQTDEAGKPTDIAPPLAETRELGPDVEIRFLDADREWPTCGRQSLFRHPQRGSRASDGSYGPGFLLSRE